MESCLRALCGPKASCVFHPHHAGNEVQGIRVESFGAASSPYFEKAMM